LIDYSRLEIAGSFLCVRILLETKNILVRYWLIPYFIHYQFFFLLFCVILLWLWICVFLLVF